MRFNDVNGRLLPLLQTCTKLRPPGAAECLHAAVVTMGPYSAQPIYLHNNLISLYVAAGELATARRVFDEMPHRNTVSYNALISAYTQRGCVGEALRIFKDMIGVGLEPTQHSVSGLLADTSAGYFIGVQLQGMVMKSGLFYADAFVGTALLNLYGRNGYLDEAFGVFEDMPRKNTVTWNSMLTLFGHNGFYELCGHFFRELMRGGAALSESSIIGVLSGSIGGEEFLLGEQVHGLVIKDGYCSEVSVVNSLLSMYATCRGPWLAENLFEEVGFRDDAVSWNIIIGAWANCGQPERTLELFVRMLGGSVLPNQATFSTVVGSCINLGLIIVEFLQAKIIKNAYAGYAFVGTALVDFYSKCGKLGAAYACFNEIREKSVVSWNALLSGYANHQSNHTSFLFREMVKMGQQPNESTFSVVLKSSSCFELQQLHCMVAKMGYESNGHVLSSLISSYARRGLTYDAFAFLPASDDELVVGLTNSIAGIYNRSGQYIEAVKLLSRLEEPDIVSWNIVIAACARSYNYAEVLELFKHMHMIGIRPDEFTFVSLLTVCSRLCNLSLGSSIHCLMIKLNVNQRDAITSNILMDMYGKCGDIGSLVKIFKRVTEKNIITWTVLISAYGMNGRPLDALEKFKEMVSTGIRPDSVLLNAVLTVCRHGGLIEEGMELFRHIKTRYEIEPEMYHYHCMVDLLTRSGHFKDAEEMVASMPFPPSPAIWRSFLQGCERTTEGGEDKGFIPSQLQTSVLNQNQINLYTEQLAL